LYLSLCLLFLISSSFIKNENTNLLGDMLTTNFIDASELDSIIKNSNKNYTLVYIYAYWCRPCVEKAPKIIELAKNNNQLDLIFVNTDKPNDYLNTKKYLESIDFSYHSYTASEDYGNGRNKRLGNFIDAICPSCRSKDMGYSSCILYDNQGKVVFSSTYEMKDAIEQIQNTISK
jgi:thiol-disulfide isomerase/thioredoxin